MNQHDSDRRFGTLSLEWFQGDEPGNFGWRGPACDPPLPPQQLASLLRQVADTVEENAREVGSWDEQATQ